MSFQRPELFFEACRDGVMGPSLDANEVSGTNAILAAMEGLPVSYVAYALATAWHETAHTMQPVKEYGGPSYFFRMYDIKGQRPKVARALGNLQSGDGVKFCGRGYVQLTGRTNYEKCGAKIGIDLIASPDLAMGAKTAGLIMRWGMETGAFTGKSLKSYLPSAGSATKDQFTQARRIINGIDKARDIAVYAVKFQDALIAGGWQ